MSTTPSTPPDPTFKIDVAKIDWDGVFKTLVTVIQESSLDKLMLRAFINAAAAVSAEKTAAGVQFVNEMGTKAEDTLIGFAEGKSAADLGPLEAFTDRMATMAISFLVSLGRIAGNKIDAVEKNAAPELLKAAAAGLSDYFGIDITPEELSVRGGTDKRRQVSDKIGKFVMQQMFGEFDRPGELTPKQGHENAERLLGFNLSTALEGWMSGILSSSVLTKLFPNWADLDEVVAQNLGLGRLNRRILGPLLDATIVIPWRWDINKRLRPRFFSETQALRALFRGEISDEDYFEALARIGWSREKAATLKVVNARLLEKEDITKAIELGIMTEDEAKEQFRSLGYPPDLAEVMQRLAIDDRIRTLNNAIESTARDMFRDREIDEVEFRRLLDVSGRSILETDIMIGLAFIERSRPRRMTRGLMERALRDDFIDLGAYRSYLVQEGYAPDDVVLLEQMALQRKFDQEEKEREREDARKAKAERAKT